MKKMSIWTWLGAVFPILFLFLMMSVFHMKTWSRGWTPSCCRPSIQVSLSNRRASLLPGGRGDRPHRKTGADSAAPVCCNRGLPVRYPIPRIHRRSRSPHRDRCGRAVLSLPEPWPTDRPSSRRYAPCWP